MYGYETIDEQITVNGVDFDPHKRVMVRPKELVWNNRPYEITYINHYSREKEGEHVVHVMWVSDGVNFFQLKFYPLTLVWKLGRVSDNETH